jgi:hypothetical protein
LGIARSNLDLQGKSGLLIDLTSLGALTEAYYSGQLTNPQAVPNFERALRQGDPAVRQLFEVLSNAISFDLFLVHGASFEALPVQSKIENSLVESGFDDFTFAVWVDGSISKKVASNIEKFREAVWNSPTNKRRGLSLAELMDVREPSGLDDENFRRLCRLRFDRSEFLGHDLKLPGMSIERLLFYLELARTMDVPVTLARSRYDALSKFEGRINKVVNGLVKSRIRGTPDS